MIEQCVAMRLDIFCTGVILGGVTVFVAQWAIKFLELWLGNNQKKLDLELGGALAKMKEDLRKSKVDAGNKPFITAVVDDMMPKSVWCEGIAIEGMNVGDQIVYNPANGHTKIKRP